MKQNLKLLMILVVAVAFVLNIDLFAQEKPIQLSLFNPVQIVKEDQSVKGFRFNLIYGKNAAMTGLDIGLVNMSTGLQKGVQWGGVSMTYGGFVGWQNNFASISKGDFTGLQTGSINYHEGHFHGLQVAVVNYTKTMNGIQLGLINIISQGGFLPVFPFFNFSFK